MSIPPNLLIQFLVGISIGMTAGYLGSLLLSRQMALVGDAMGHIALPGIGLAALVHILPELGAFLSLLLGAYLVWKLKQVTPFHSETLVGILFLVALSLGFLIVPEPELLENLMGDLKQCTPLSAVLALVSCSAIAYPLYRLYSGMVLDSLSEDLALLEGYSSQTLHLVLLLSLAIILSVGVKLTGTLLLGALLILPASSARVCSRSLSQFQLYSSALGGLGSILGITVSTLTLLPAGPSLILIHSALFLICLFYSLRRRNPHAARSPLSALDDDT